MTLAADFTQDLRSAVLGAAGADDDESEPMSLQLKPDLFKKMSSTQLIRKLVLQDIKSSAGKDIFFVVAKNVPVDGKPESLFLLAEKTAPWEAVLKQMKAASVTVGECRIVAGATPKIAVKSAKGGTKSEVIALLKTVVKEVPAVDYADHVKSVVQASHDKAGTGVKIDGEIFNAMMKRSVELTEYKKFAESFAKLAEKYKMTDYKKVPVNIWADLLKGLIKSGYVNEKIPKAADGTSFVLAFAGDDGKPVREKALADAMTGLQKFTAHAGKYLDSVVAEVLKAGGTPTWSFWSGTGAQHTAKAENSSGVVLEGSVGSWFDAVWDFKPFSGVENLALWTSLSELYAQKAAEYYDVFSFRGYVGPGATRDQSVFNKIEQPVFIEVLTVKKKVDAPKVDWFVVDCDKDGDNWKPSGKPSEKFASRDDAIARVKERYGS